MENAAKQERPPFALRLQLDTRHKLREKGADQVIGLIIQRQNIP